MRIEARSNQSIDQIFDNLTGMPEWDQEKMKLVDPDFQSSAVIETEEAYGALYSIKITTAWSGFTYVIKRGGDDYSEIEYWGAFKGFLSQNLLPDLGEVTVSEANGTFVGTSFLDLHLTEVAFAHIRQKLHSDVTACITPFHIGDIKWDQELFKKLGLEYRTYGGWTSISCSTGSILTAWTTPERHEELAKAFQPLEKRPENMEGNMKEVVINLLAIK